MYYEYIVYDEQFQKPFVFRFHHNIHGINILYTYINFDTVTGKGEKSFESGNFGRKVN